MSPADDEKRAAFLYELLRDANARLAATRAGLTRGTVYRWKLEDPEFAALWAEIVASRPRRRDLRRRVLERGQNRTRRRETSHLAPHATIAATPPKAAWDKDLGPAFKVRW
ncbi:MAG: hypothetical protein Q8K93_33850 [Reyranella sp.]|uniref:hypothetical protein n=1 Tax=Reyranella sp. TaxID=1929291 RepID=UPI0027320004|nr:hypothetical protein [Reyranella sp.]MDP1967184.1 hypothetical protein [Reyranella sp.]MDP2373794.1 hypothetical protein [Reyranella sp.]